LIEKKKLRLFHRWQWIMIPSQRNI
jgi:hypothetical protein